MKTAATMLVLFTATGCGSTLCQEDGCFFTADEWTRVESLTGLGPPKADPANRYSENEGAAALGQAFFFDTRFSGVATQIDTTGQRSAPARAPIGSPVEMSCSTCHNPARGGIDHTSSPGHVSVGAGWYDVNAQSVINAAYYDLVYWNGRYDSLVWQAMSVAESPVSLNGNRVRIARTIWELYRSEYDAVFTEDPLPNFVRTATAQAGILETDGQCEFVGGRCPTELDCVEDTSGCWPRWPLDGRSRDGTCERGTGPFGDAYDCMAEADQTQILHVYINFAKAIAAYEQTLVSGDTPFDRFVRDGPDSELLAPSARRGLKLFVGRASCIECHNTALFSDNMFHNIGVPQVGAAVPDETTCPPDEGSCSAWGAHNGLALLQQNTTFRADSVAFSDDPTDRTRQQFYDLEITDALKGAWRTPSLRDVVSTPPYMHTGFYRSLAEVVEHYDRGGTGVGAAPDQRSKRVTPLGLSQQEKADLVSFLETLTSDPLPRERVTAPDLP